MLRKHIPRRTCVGCGTSRPKKELIRIVRNPEGQVKIDLTGKKSGRGAYICPNLPCLEKALAQRQIEKALQVKIEPEIKAALKQVLHEQDL